MSTPRRIAAVLAGIISGLAVIKRLNKELLWLNVYAMSDESYYKYVTETAPNYEQLTRDVQSSNGTSPKGLVIPFVEGRVTVASALRSIKEFILGPKTFVFLLRLYIRKIKAGTLAYENRVSSES